MSLVQDPPATTTSPAPLGDPHERPANGDPRQRPAWADPQQGVIEEARKRQRRRRVRVGIGASIVAVGLMALAFVLETSHATPARRGATRRPMPAGHASTSSAPDFNVRFAPTLNVGQAGWQLFYEEHGTQAGGEANGPALSSDPIVASFGGGSGSSHRWVSKLVTTPNVAAILVDGKTRVPTVPLRGLPYGFRAARIVTAVSSTEERVPQGPGSRPLGPSSLVPLDAEGQPIQYKPNNRTPSQGKVRSWEYPAATPDGSCGLRASGLSGLTAQSGKVLSGVRPYPAALVGGQIAGHAFLPCVSVLYHLRGMPLQALILLDAANPHARVAALPDFKPVRGAPEFVDQGGLTARRQGGAWLIVSQGAGVAQRVQLLRHLRGLVSLSSPIPASASVPEVGQANAPPPPTNPVELRVAPALQAGALGWEYVETEANGAGGGSCCSALTHPAQILSGSKSSGSGPWWTATVLAAPEVAAVSLEGRAPVPTRSGGLPYGMRSAIVPVKHLGVTPVAYDAHGQQVKTKGFETLPKRHEFEGPYAPHTWTAPASPPASAACALSASGLSGLSPIGGGVVLHVTGYKVFESHAFQSCADTDYRLGKSTLLAAVLLDAEHPGSKPAALPYMKPVSGLPGVFEALGGGFMHGLNGSHELTAKRLPGAWLVVTGGSGPAQQHKALRSLHASVHIQ